MSLNFDGNIYTMSEFFKELKALRKRQDIDLEEISNRTKINIGYLKDLENGLFDVLPKAYIRLFLRAYVTEIGGNAEEALNNLEHFLGNGTKKEVPVPEEPVVTEVDHEPRQDILRPPRSSMRIRSDLIKGVVLVTVLIFSIYIIRTINASASPTDTDEIYSAYSIDEESISEVQLINNFDLLMNLTEKFDAAPPFNVKVVATQRVWYRVKKDTTGSIEEILPAGDNRLHGFSSSLDLLFNHTNGINLYLNGSIVKSVSDSNNPVRVTLYTDPNTVTIKRFAPKS